LLSGQDSHTLLVVEVHGLVWCWFKAQGSVQASMWAPPKQKLLEGHELQTLLLVLVQGVVSYSPATHGAVQLDCVRPLQ